MADETVRVTGALPPEPAAEVPPMAPAQATEQRAKLLADASFRAAAMDSKGPQWAQLQELDRSIAAGLDAEEAASEEHVEGEPPPAPGAIEDPVIPPGAFDPPPTPAGYDLPTTKARQMGLDVDPQAEIDLRTSLHAAGADPKLAQVLYTVAMNAAQQDMTPVTVHSEYLKSEAALRKSWGSEFDQRLALANAEGRRLFEALPASVKDGMGYQEWALVHGMANSRASVEQLYLRAKARKAAGN